MRSFNALDDVGTSIFMLSLLRVYMSLARHDRWTAENNESSPELVSIGWTACLVASGSNENIAPAHLWLSKPEHLTRGPQFAGGSGGILTKLSSSSDCFCLGADATGFLAFGIFLFGTSPSDASSDDDHWLDIGKGLVMVSPDAIGRCAGGGISGFDGNATGGGRFLTSSDKI